MAASARCAEQTLQRGVLTTELIHHRPESFAIAFFRRKRAF
jgi:hypothetical protein